MESMIRDISLAESGQKKIDWVKGHMPLLNYFNEKYAPTQLFKGINSADAEKLRRQRDGYRQ